MVCSRALIFYSITRVALDRSYLLLLLLLVTLLLNGGFCVFFLFWSRIALRQSPVCYIPQLTKPEGHSVLAKKSGAWNHFDASVCVQVQCLPGILTATLWFWWVLLSVFQVCHVWEMAVGESSPDLRIQRFWKSEKSLGILKGIVWPKYGKRAKPVWVWRKCRLSQNVAIFPLLRGQQILSFLTFLLFFDGKKKSSVDVGNRSYKYTSMSWSEVSRRRFLDLWRWFRGMKDGFNFGTGILKQIWFGKVWETSGMLPKFVWTLILDTTVLLLSVKMFW